MSISKEDILEYHLGGKIGLRLTKELTDSDALCKAYTPGVAVPVREIHAKPELADKYTARSNLVAVVTDGTAVLGLGDVGPTASIPVMEGKAVLFKAFGDVDSWPVPLDHCRQDSRNEGPTDPQRVIDATLSIAPMYGGINLEDIAAPACFEIERELDRLLQMPVFHDDQWGTAVITLAGLMNYCTLADRTMEELRVVINGAGAAGIRIAEMIKAAGCGDVVLCDSKGAIYRGREGLNKKKAEHAADTEARTLSEAMKGANVFVGVSVADCVETDDILSMADYPAIFAMANPDPEILPEAVAECMGEKDYIMATGRSDYPNQINNVLGFPFLFRGALDSGATAINLEMKIAASEALARVARESPPDHALDLFHSKEDLEFGPNCIVPKPFDGRLFTEVSYAVAAAAVESGIAPEMDLDAYHADLQKRNSARFA